MADLKALTFDEVKIVASQTKGFAYDKKISEKELRVALEVYIEENPTSISQETSAKKEEQEPKKDSVKEDSPKKGSLVSIQSEYRGEITVGREKIDFGEDGKVKVSPEIAKVLVSLKGYEKC